jgi:hypothetical protein
MLSGIVARVSCQSIEDHKDMERKRDELKNAAYAIADFSVSFRSDFERAAQYKQKEAVQRCLKEIVVDRTDKVARCFFRPMPIVGGPAGELVEWIENATVAPDSPVPLRRVDVPGTGLEPARPRGH